MAPQYDLIVIGSGTGGYVAAIRAAQLGLSTAVIERQPVLGGTCLNWGCIPTKALLEHAHALKIATRAADWGIDFGPTATSPTIDMAKVHARKDRIVAGLTKGVEFLFKKNRITWIKGNASLAGGGAVEVIGESNTIVTAKEIVIATGSAPRGLPGIEVDHAAVITSDDAIQLAQVPASIGIVGSGAVGVEFASIFRQFGSAVTLVELQSRIVPNEDAAVSAELEKVFRRRGITVHTSSTVAKVAVTASGVVMEIGGVGGSESVTVEKLLVAIGRRPVTEGLVAREAGLTLRDGFIVVDERFRTSVPGVSAIGDVITVGDRPRQQLAHLASAEGIAVAERIAGLDVPPINYDQVPACTFSDPEIGSVGLTEQEARSRGYDVCVGTFPFSVLGRAKIAGETDGFVKIVGEKRYDEFLGLHVIGPRATEIVAEGTMALRLEATVEEVVRTIHAHPTSSEAIGEAAHALRGGALHL